MKFSFSLLVILMLAISAFGQDIGPSSSFLEAGGLSFDEYESATPMDMAAIEISSSKPRGRSNGDAIDDAAVVAPATAAAAVAAAAATPAAAATATPAAAATATATPAAAAAVAAPAAAATAAAKPTNAVGATYFYYGAQAAAAGAPSVSTHPEVVNAFQNLDQASVSLQEKLRQIDAARSQLYESLNAHQSIVDQGLLINPAVTAAEQHVLADHLARANAVDVPVYHPLSTAAAAAVAGVATPAVDVPVYHPLATAYPTASPAVASVYPSAHFPGAGLSLNHPDHNDIFDESAALLAQKQAAVEFKEHKVHELEHVVRQLKREELLDTADILRVKIRIAKQLNKVAARASRDVKRLKKLYEQKRNEYKVLAREFKNRWTLPKNKKDLEHFDLPDRNDLVTRSAISRHEVNLEDQAERLNNQLNSLKTAQQQSKDAMKDAGVKLSLLSVNQQQQTEQQQSKQQQQTQTSTQSETESDESMDEEHAILNEIQNEESDESLENHSNDAMLSELKKLQHEDEHLMHSYSRFRSRLQQ